jgi:hypothetical protein
LEILASSGVSLKLETDGNLIDDRAAERLAELAVDCVQISVDGATAATHDRLRPGSTYAGATAAIERLVARNLAPQWVFVPTRFNLHEIGAAYDLAATKGCSAFITGPLMRLGRAAREWDAIACDDVAWQRAVGELHQRARANPTPMALSIYPWDIVDEMERRIDHPQAMLLIVPNGKVKLLNALPFAPADLRRDSIDDAWNAYRSAWRAPCVREFVAAAGAATLLRHARRDVGDERTLVRDWSKPDRRVGSGENQGSRGSGRRRGACADGRSARVTYASTTCWRSSRTPGRELREHRRSVVAGRSRSGSRAPRARQVPLAVEMAERPTFHFYRHPLGPPLGVTSAEAEAHAVHIDVDVGDHDRLVAADDRRARAPRQEFGVALRRFDQVEHLRRGMRDEHGLAQFHPRILVY